MQAAGLSEVVVFAATNQDVGYCSSLTTSVLSTDESRERGRAFDLQPTRTPWSLPDTHILGPGALIRETSSGFACFLPFYLLLHKAAACLKSLCLLSSQ
jgi:hypothetical protein